MSKKSIKTDPPEDMEVCCVCTSMKSEKFNRISSNFVKIENKFIPIADIILNQLKLIHYEVNSLLLISTKLTFRF